MTMAQTIQRMQLDDAIAEVAQAVPANPRARERVLGAVVAGSSAILSGPTGAGKSYTAQSVATALGIPHRSPAPTEHLASAVMDGSGEVLIVEDIDRATEAAQYELAEALQSRPRSILIGTVTVDPANGGGVVPRIERRLVDTSLMFVEFSYPDFATERLAALQGLEPARPVERLLTAADASMLRESMTALLVSDDVVDYAVRLVSTTRDPGSFGLENLAGLMSGASPRASIALLTAARATALLRGRPAVTAQEVYDVAYEVLVHRIEPTATAAARGIGTGDILVELLSRTPARTS